VKNFKKHQRLKDHYNWVHFSSGPLSSQAPRQALATQGVALVTVLKDNFRVWSKLEQILNRNIVSNIS